MIPDVSSGSVFHVSDGWTCDAVFFDGTNVRDRCVAIFYNDVGHPSAVELFLLDDQAKIYVNADGDVAREIVSGTIEVYNLHRVLREVTPQEDYGRDAADGAACRAMAMMLSQNARR